MNLNEQTIFNEVMTYSIDNSNHENNNALKSVQLNSDTFYDSGIYVSRTKKENQIKEILLAPNGAIRIVGKAGSGKTTVATKVLRDLSEDYLCQKIDVKKDTGIENEDCCKIAGLNEHLNKALLKLLNNSLLDHEISRDKVLIFFITAEGKAREHIRKNGDFTNYHSKLKQITGRIKAYDLDKWINDVKYNTEYDKLLDSLFNSLYPENLAYFLVNSARLYKSTIFYWDNVDSIIDETIRKTFFELIDKFQSEKSDCMVIMVSFRSNNPSFEPADNGTYNNNTIDMDTIDDEVFAEETQEEGSNNTLTEELYRSSKNLSRNNERFLLKMLDQRVNYLKTQSESIHQDFSKERIEELNNLMFSFLNTKHFETALTSIGNYDRRESLTLITGFVKYLMDFNHFSTISQIEDSKLRMTIYESYFYYWLAVGSNVFKNNITNVITELDNWLEKPNSHRGCISDIQLMNFVFNKNPYSNKIKRKTELTVEKVIEEFEFIGIKERAVKEIIFRIYKDRNRYLGFMELSKYYGINSTEEILMNYTINLTPRGENYIRHTNFKYTYLFALIKTKNQLSLGYDPVSLESFKEVINFSISLGVMYINGLQKIKRTLKPLFNQGRDSWINYYIDNFCLTTPMGKLGNKDKLESLHYCNLLNSHLKYVDTLERNKPQEEAIDKFIILKKNYKNLLDNFKQLVKIVIESETEIHNVQEKLEQNIHFSLN